MQKWKVVLKRQLGPTDNPVIVEAPEFAWGDYAVLFRSTTGGSQTIIAGFARESVISVTKFEEPPA